MQQCIFSNKDTLLFVYKRNNSHKLHIQSGYGSPCSSRSVPIKATGSPRSFFATIRCLKGLSKAALFLFQLHIFPCHPSFFIYEFKSDTGHTIS